MEKYTNQQLEEYAGRLPCACGKRETSEPQNIVEGTLIVTDDSYDLPHGSASVLRHECMMTCGICKEIHLLKADKVEDERLKI